MTPGGHCEQRGFSLLEVVVSGALLAVALLGLGALAARSLDDAAATLDQRVAFLLLSDLQGRVALLDREGSTGGPTAALVGELADWRRAIDDLLPAGQTGLCLDGAPVGATAAGTCSGAAGWEADLRWQRRPGAPEDRQTLRWAR